MNTPEGKERIVRLEVLQDETRKEVRDGFFRIEKQLDKIHERMDSADEKLGRAEERIATASVGFKTLLWVASILTTVAGTIGAFVAKYLPFFGSAPR